MPVPESIRKVERPKNTVVVDTGSNSPKRYAVRKRGEVVYVPGGNPQPHNGEVVGHIINNRFVPRASRATDELEALSYGACALIESVSGDLYEDLLQVYDCKEAATIMAIASLKVLHPGVPYSRMSTHYDRSFVQKYYPGVPLSKNTIGDLLQRLGKDGPKRAAFYKLRLERVAKEHHIAIDGMLKQDTSSVNDLSAFSYKSRFKKHKDVSILYAYDIDLMEPICAEVFPGNETDATSYPVFIRDNNITRGLIINDKAFTPKSIEDLLTERPDLHFLTPLKRNDKRIANNDMLKFTGTVEGLGGKVLFKKCKIRGGRFLYSFKSEEKAVSEQHAYFGRAHKKGLDADKIQEKMLLFGVVVFESDVDLEPCIIYRAYEERWLIELLFKRYKSDECLDQTNVQGDFSIIGAELVNFLATVLTSRILGKAEKAEILDNISLGDLLDDLGSAWRMTDAPLDTLPKRGDCYWVHTLQKVFDELEALGLVEASPKARKRTKASKEHETSKKAGTTKEAKTANASRTTKKTATPKEVSNTRTANASKTIKKTVAPKEVSNTRTAKDAKAANTSKMTKKTAASKKASNTKIPGSSAATNVSQHAEVAQTFEDAKRPRPSKDTIDKAIETSDKEEIESG